ncbi:DhaL domain superfamily protein [Pleurotus pulmonarius]
MDVIAGDGDCGLTLKGGADAVLKKRSTGQMRCVEQAVLYTRLQSNLPGGHTVAKAWSVSLSSALEKLYTYTRARPPSRTLVDPLASFIDVLAKEEGEATRGHPGSAYVEGARLKDQKVPDPGAWSVKVILENLIKI